MQQHQEIASFSILGGPLHRLGCQLGLVREQTNTMAMGLALGACLWIVLVVLTWLEGLGHKVFALPAIGAHVRLLLAIPLFFACEAAIAPRMAKFVREVVKAGVAPKAVLPALASEISRIARWKDAWLPEALCLLAAVLLTLAGPQLNLPGVTATYDPGRATGAMTLTGAWYWAVCMTLFRFLMIRWLWRLVLWCHLLWCVSRLELHLVPTHPDSAAGLGYLEVVHSEFVPLVLAFSIVLAASFAEQIAVGTMAFEAIYPKIIVVLALDALLFVGPLWIFASKLWICRLDGLSDYMVFASRYVNDFDRKWLGADARPENSPLGESDIQSLADLNTGVGIVRGMRLAPWSPRLLMLLGAAAVAPMLPLLLFKAPLNVLAEQLLKMLLGL